MLEYAASTHTGMEKNLKCLPKEKNACETIQIA